MQQEVKGYYGKLHIWLISMRSMEDLSITKGYELACNRVIMGTELPMLSLLWVSCVTYDIKVFCLYISCMKYLSNNQSKHIRLGLTRAHYGPYFLGSVSYFGQRPTL